MKMSTRKVLSCSLPLMVTCGIVALGGCSTDDGTDGSPMGGAPAGGAAPTAGTGQGGAAPVAGTGPGGSAPVAGSGTAGSGTAGSGTAGSGTGGSGTAGASAGTGGADPSGGVGGASGGTGGGAAGAPGGCPVVPATPITCATGCAVICAPLSAAMTGTQFELKLSSPMDLTGSTVTFRMRATGGAEALAASGIQTAAQNGEALAYKAIGYEGDRWKAGTDLAADFVDVTLDIDASTTANATVGFDKTMVYQFVVKIAAADLGTWGPVQVYIDSISVTGGTATVGPYDFTADFMPLTKATYMEVVGSTIGHQGGT